MQSSRLYKELRNSKQAKYQTSKNFIVLFLLILSSVLIAQEKKEKPELENSKHSLNIELYGNHYSPINLRYEYTSKKSLALGAGLGFVALEDNLYTINYTGSPDDETVWSKRIVITIPLYMTLKTHKNKRHHMLFTFAVTPVVSCIFKGYSKDIMGSRIRKSYIIPAFALGYEYNPGSFYFRFNIYAQYIGDNAISLPVLPWFGLSVGRYFKRVKK